MFLAKPGHILIKLNLFEAQECKQHALSAIVVVAVLEQVIAVFEQVIAASRMERKESTWSTFAEFLEPSINSQNTPSLGAEEVVSKNILSNKTSLGRGRVSI